VLGRVLPVGDAREVEQAPAGDERHGVVVLVAVEDDCTTTSSSRQHTRRCHEVAQQGHAGNTTGAVAMQGAALGRARLTFPDACLDEELGTLVAGEQRHVQPAVLGTGTVLVEHGIHLSVAHLQANSATGVCGNRCLLSFRMQGNRQRRWRWPGTHVGVLGVQWRGAFAIPRQNVIAAARRHAVVSDAHDAVVGVNDARAHLGGGVCSGGGETDAVVAGEATGAVERRPPSRPRSAPSSADRALAPLLRIADKKATPKK